MVFTPFYPFIFKELVQLPQITEGLFAFINLLIIV